jgi:hypothetical protein
MKSEHDKGLDELAIRMSNCVSGERLLDVVMVCARMIAFAIHEVYETEEEKIAAMNRLIAFMRTDLAGMNKDETVN